MISAPTPHSFLHIAHVGLNKDGAIDISEGLDPSWGAALGGYRDAGSKKMMANGDTGFVEGIRKGVNAMGTRNSSETTIVNTTNVRKFSY